VFFKPKGGKEKLCKRKGGKKNILGENLYADRGVVQTHLHGVRRPNRYQIEKRGGELFSGQEAFLAGRKRKGERTRRRERFFPEAAVWKRELNNRSSAKEENMSNRRERSASE